MRDQIMSLQKLAADRLQNDKLDDPTKTKNVKLVMMKQNSINENLKG
jgi:hypothetical protein